MTTTYGNRYMILTLAIVAMLRRIRDLERLERLKMRSIRLTTLHHLALTIDLHSKELIKVCEYSGVFRSFLRGVGMVRQVDNFISKSG